MEEKEKMISTISYFTVAHYDKQGDEVRNFAVWDRINAYLEKEHISAENVINVSEHSGYTRVYYRIFDNNERILGEIIK